MPSVDVYACAANTEDLPSRHNAKRYYEEGQLCPYLGKLVHIAAAAFASMPISVTPHAAALLAARWRASYNQFIHTLSGLRLKTKLKTESDCTFTLAIDGPAASGKTVIGREVARRLGARFLDTGSMYRAVTWASIQQDIPSDDSCRLSSLAARTKMQLISTADEDRLLLDGEDITDLLRLPEVDANVSAVSAVSGVRRALVERQRIIASDGPIVMCGRDISTVVLPYACVKIFLTASPEVRAARRAADAAARSEHYDESQALAELQRRDRIDSQREDSPLHPADDAFIICSDRMTIEEVVREILLKVRQC